PEHAPSDADVVFHASATGAGLACAIACAGEETSIVELSWYGDKVVSVGLGASFHSRRLRLLASQVGQVSPSRRPRWSFRRRLQALPALVALVAEDVAFEAAARALPQVLAADAGGLAPVIHYSEV